MSKYQLFTNVCELNIKILNDFTLQNIAMKNETIIR